MRTGPPRCRHRGGSGNRGWNGRSNPMTLRLVVLASFTILLCAPARALSSECSAALTDDDASMVRAVVEAYRAAWLRGDAQGVMKTLTDDAVLLPAHGARQIGRAHV